MSKRMSKKLSAAALLAVCSTAMGVENGAALPAAADELMRMYPGSNVAQNQGRVQALYGVPMTPGLDARGAANLFIQQHGQAFGCGPLSLAEDWSGNFADGSKTVLVYQQYLSGYPVEYGMLKVLVLNGAVPRVVYAGGTLAPAPEAQFAPKITGEAALSGVKSMPAWKKVPSWTKPELVVWQGNGDWIAPVLTWKFTGESLVPDDKLCKTFFVNASTGAIEYIREDVYYSDVSGSIKGMASPGVYPDAAYNPPALINIPGMRAQITGGNNAYSGTGGLFTITNPGTTPVDLTCGTNGAGAGQWVNVIPQSLGPAVTGSLVGITPPGPADFVLNPAPSEGLTAQVNAFICTTITHNYIKQYAPSLTRWDIQIPCNTGVAGTCNAFFSGSGGPNINFYNTGGGCSNTAYSTVVSHEYGHFIVSRLGPTGSGLAQNAFGEGYGDVTAELIWDDYVTGRGFQLTQSSYVRDPIAANVQYPCGSPACPTQEIHCCGQIISGVWWRIRSNMGTLLGSTPGLEATRQLQVNWALITAGGPSSVNSAGPTTAIEVLTADDNDGNINNGTPHYTQICSAFAAHSIQCPAIVLLAFQYPSGRPATVAPNTPTNVPVNVVGVSGTPQPGTGTLSYRVNGGSFTTVPMAQGAANQYTATLPAAPCGANIDYYVSAQTTTAQSQSDPNNAPTSFFSAASAASASTTSLDFNTDPGWAVTNTALTSGAWQRGVPVAAGSTGAPGVDYDGSGQCWVTDNRAGAEGFADVDGGPTVLTTGTYDLSGYVSATVSYARWLESHNGVTDSMVFQVSSDGGANWTTLETATTQAAWTVKTFNVPTLSSQVQFRWSVSDNPNDSVTEAGIDAFKLVAISCAQTCYANCDSSTTPPILNVQDFACFLNKFASGDTYANCDGSTTAPVLNVQDFSCFLNRFAEGCT